VTVIEYLNSWLKTSIKLPMRRPATYKLYRSIIAQHVAKDPIAHIPPQKLWPSHLERYLADVPGAASSLQVHHAILHKALRKAAKDRLVVISPALGQPIATLSEGPFQRLAKDAGVKKIKFHGCRHTVATLSLVAGVPAHVVADRLGQSVNELMKTYAHALPGMRQDAATLLGAVLAAR
jgi:integrase